MTYTLHPDRMRRGVMTWAGIVLLPMMASGGVLAVCDGLPLTVRASVFFAGLVLTFALGWLAGYRSLGTLAAVSDLLGALREGDFGMRGRVRPGYDPLQDLMADVNLLSDELREGRRKRTATSRFLGKTLVALGDPVFVVDDKDALRLINPSARKLIGAERSTVIGQDVKSLGLTEVLAAPDNAVFNGRFPGGSGRWSIRRAAWHSDGREHRLLMLRDLSVALGEEERRAWQRLIRVLSHELNNSLTPIGSLAGSLSTLLAERGVDETREELQIGLEVIERRAVSLARFLSGYGKLARLPPLHVRLFRLDRVLSGLAMFEQRLPVAIVGVEAVTLSGDEDQLTQAFINLLRNAVEAALPVSGAVRVDWRLEGRYVRIVIEDGGIGLPSSDALFVPYFTTKPEGSGIGLSLTRMIVEAHGGTVELSPMVDAPGAVATVRLPLGG